MNWKLENFKPGTGNGYGGAINPTTTSSASEVLNQNDITTDEAAASFHFVVIKLQDHLKSLLDKVIVTEVS